MTWESIKNILKITFVLIGTVIGAGFASGQEIYSFFNSYGKSGLIGIFVSISLIGVITYKALNICRKYDINNYYELIEIIIPKRLKNNKVVIFTIKNIINIFLLISFNIMIAGFASYFFQEFGTPKIYGAIFISSLCFITFKKNINGIIRINTYLIPIIIFLIIYLGIIKINESSFNLVSLDSNNSKNMYWILSSILYTSYNSITLIPIIINIKNKIKNKKEIYLITFFLIAVLLCLAIVIFLLLNSVKYDIYKIEIPIVYIAASIGSIFRYIYGVIILIAIFTTAIASGYGFLSNFTNNKKTYNIISIFICFLSILIGQISFSNLIGILYPVFGYLGIMQILFILIR